MSADAAGPPALGVCFGWNRLAFEDLVALARHAERRGFRAVYVDGDVSMMPGRGDGDVLEGWTTTVALLARTELPDALYDRFVKESIDELRKHIGARQTAPA